MRRLGIPARTARGALEAVEITGTCVHRSARREVGRRRHDGGLASAPKQEFIVSIGHARHLPASKRSRGRKKETSRFGQSTTSLIFKSPATEHKPYASCGS